LTRNAQTVEVTSLACALAVYFRETLSTMDRYELERTVADYCNSRYTTPKLATVGEPPLIDGFPARVATTGGLVAETFSESQEAMDWLKSFGSNAAAPTNG
jgi:hypothetical protein